MKKGRNEKSLESIYKNGKICFLKKKWSNVFFRHNVSDRFFTIVKFLCEAWKEKQNVKRSENGGKNNRTNVCIFLLFLYTLVFNCDILGGSPQVYGNRVNVSSYDLCKRRCVMDKPFKIHSKFQPTGDQPQAIEKIADGFQNGLKFQTLVGVTGSGKTFTMANVIEKIQKPTLVIAHNKTLAAQLYNELKEFFPENAVEYFVS